MILFQVVFQGLMSILGSISETNQKYLKLKCKDFKIDSDTGHHVALLISFFWNQVCGNVLSISYSCLFQIRGFSLCVSGAVQTSRTACPHSTAIHLLTVFLLLSPPLTSNCLRAGPGLAIFIFSNRGPDLKQTLVNVG